jgi:lysophospholipase L1-like esterase
MMHKNILFFGDSIFRRAFVEKFGFAHILNAELQDQARLINCGVGGDKIYDLLIRFDKDIPPIDLDVIVINTGTNDVNHKFTRNTGTDEDKYTNYLDLLLIKLKTITPNLIVCPAAVGMEDLSGNNLRNTPHDVYTGIIKDLSIKHDVSFCDIRDAFKKHLLMHNPDNKEFGILTEDGVHLTSEGNKLYAETLLPYIQRFL